MAWSQSRLRREWAENAKATTKSKVTSTAGAPSGNSGTVDEELVVELLVVEVDKEELVLVVELEDVELVEEDELELVELVDVCEVVVVLLDVPMNARTLLLEMSASHILPEASNVRAPGFVSPVEVVAATRDVKLP